MFLFKTFFLILCASEGWSLTECELDGIERTRTFNILLTSDFMRGLYNENPGKNIITTGLFANYGFGTYASYTKCESVSVELVKTMNYTCLNQLKATIPILTRYFQSFQVTISAWSGIICADTSRRFLRVFVDGLYGFFNSNVRNTDFENPPLVASAINQLANVNTCGFATSGKLIHPDMVVNDGRFFFIATNYFEGGFTGYTNPCDTLYRDFYLPCGEIIQIPTMRIQGVHGYGKMYKYEADVLQLNFQGGDYIMYAVVPKCIEDMENILKELRNPLFFDETISCINFYNMICYLPVIDLHKNFDFKSCYEKYGNNPYLDIKTIDFAYMFDNSDGAYVSQMLVDFRMRINEGITYSNQTVPECPDDDYNRNIIQVTVNRPMIFYICSSNGVPMITGIFTGVN
ncbi:hypothetical protein K1T71_004237 [Dendrolimus kikuchii]|uniref:Uncharacterized protein n=1 Tax=Dendrolimus kikuchii TaxID=765133 RepID=A0ACC1D750_9NEOP|nr:hypothetical protein K1T71_004237 [Dendrolimus kikuchii]